MEAEEAAKRAPPTPAPVAKAPTPPAEPEVVPAEVFSASFAVSALLLISRMLMFRVNAQTDQATAPSTEDGGAAGEGTDDTSGDAPAAPEEDRDENTTEAGDA